MSNFDKIIFFVILIAILIAILIYNNYRISRPSLDRGFVGAPVTNQAEFDYAIRSLVLCGGGHIQIEKGTYTVSETIYIDKPTIIRGIDIDKTEIELEAVK